MSGKGPTPYHLLDEVERPFRKARALARRVAFISASHKAFQRRRQNALANPKSQESFSSPTRVTQSPSRPTT